MSQAELFLPDIQEEIISGPYPDFLTKYFSIPATATNHQNNDTSTLPPLDPIAIKPPENADRVVCWLNSVSAAMDHTSRVWSPLPASMRVMEGYPGSAFVLERQEDSGWDETLMVGLAIGESTFSYPLSLAQLYVLARQVFIAQPLRYTVHGLLLYGDVFELWAFDRSGMYCSEPLSFKRDYGLLLSLMAAYSHKTEEELGIKQVLQHDELGKYVPSGPNTADMKLYLQDEPFVNRDDLFDAGTLCYRAKYQHEADWTHVVKFKWQDEYNHPEEETFNYAQERVVSGIVRLAHHFQIEQTAELRSKIRHRRCKKLFAEPCTTEADVNGLMRFAQEDNRCYFSNRVLTCLIFNPIGWPVHTWRNSSELLIVLRDAVKAHRSLLQDAHLLHRDISAGNIIITGTDKEPKGLLIDLDRAMNLEKEQPAAGSIVGTRLFTAIGLLNLDVQTYRHDLESFLYLFIWLIICQGEEALPSHSRIKPWAQGSRAESAEAKVRDMKEDGFRMVLDEFDPKYEHLKALAWDLRAAVFKPDANDELWLGTDTTKAGTDSIYDQMIASLDKAFAI